KPSVANWWQCGADVIFCYGWDPVAGQDGWYNEEHQGTCQGVALDVELRLGDILVAGGVAGQFIGQGTTYRDSNASPREPAPCMYRMPTEISTLPAGSVLHL